MRLHRYIANCGQISRRRAELLVQAGRVHVNGKLLSSLGTSVKPGDVVTVNGEIARLPEPLTIAFHKPGGIITSTHDTHDRLTVTDLLSTSLRQHGVLPVGRLDQDTEGLLLLTNLGDLNHCVTHPSFELDKEYRAVVAGRPTRASLERLEAGIRIAGQRTAPASIAAVEPRGKRTAVTLVIHEGRKRQVRRMFLAIGHEVLELCRLRVGGVQLADLPRGEWRELGDDEAESLAPDYGKILAAYLRVRDSVSAPDARS